ncbi:MAG TPA: PA14 domain-containing protein, partial [Verrucomicrobiae bacterium]
MTTSHPAPILIPLRLALLAVTILALAAGAATIRTRDGKLLEGELRFNDAGALVLRPGEGESITIELKDVARATFESGTFFSSGSILPNGWKAQDIGDARGSARLDANTFALRVEGRSTNLTSSHFVSRALPSNGDFWVRVEEITGNGPANAGIMIRSENNSAFAAISLGNDGKLLFLSRGDPSRKEIRLTRGPSISTPILLRLQKRDTAVSAMYSKDARMWETLAIEPIKISPQKTWREGEGDLQLLRASCGVFVSSRGIDTLANARLTPITRMLQGLLGEYFGDRDFADLRMARLDPQVRFNWRTTSPYPTLDKNHFSVRWTGKIVARKAGNYRFCFDADDRAQLWINEMEMPAVSLKKYGNELEIPYFSLHAGSSVNVKLEYENSGGEASVQLGWALQGHAPEVIDMTNFLYMFNATNSPESIALARATNNTPAVGGVLLRDGSFLAGAVTSADESAVRIGYPGKKDVTVLNSRVARIHLRPSRQPLRFEIAQGRTGVFTKSGDFLESEFKRIE